MASFNIDFPGSASNFVVSATKTMQTKGGVFQGNEKTGTFNIKTLIGSIKGTYQVLSTVGSVTQVAINILQKPALVPMSKIQSEIRKYF
jgi:hypothetical protein